MIRIRSKNPGFRRGGMAHSTEWTEYPDNRFKKKQLARLQAEPMLQVEFVQDTVETPEPTAAAPDLEGEVYPKTDSVSETESVSPPPTRKPSKAGKA